MTYRECRRRADEALRAGDFEAYCAYIRWSDGHYSVWDRLPVFGRIIAIVLAVVWFGAPMVAVLIKAANA